MRRTGRDMECTVRTVKQKRGGGRRLEILHAISTVKLKVAIAQ